MRGSALTGVAAGDVLPVPLPRPLRRALCLDGCLPLVLLTFLARTFLLGLSSWLSGENSCFLMVSATLISPAATAKTLNRILVGHTSQGNSSLKDKAVQVLPDALSLCLGSRSTLAFPVLSSSKCSMRMFRRRRWALVARVSCGVPRVPYR